MSEIITSKENPAVKHAARLLKSAKFRRQEEAFLAEGVRLCRDAAYSGVRILRMFYTEEALERYPQDVELLREKAERAGYRGSKAILQGKCVGSGGWRSF